MNESIEQKEQKVNPTPETAAQLVRTAKRYGRRKISGEDKIRIVLEGLRGEETITDICYLSGLGTSLAKSDLSLCVDSQKNISLKPSTLERLPIGWKVVYDVKDVIGSRENILKEHPETLDAKMLPPSTNAELEK